MYPRPAGCDKMKKSDSDHSILGSLRPVALPYYRSPDIGILPYRTRYTGVFHSKPLRSFVLSLVKSS